VRLRLCGWKIFKPIMALLWNGTVFEPRLMLPQSLTCDHWVIYGDGLHPSQRLLGPHLG
jgi:hypothetical protein